MKKAYKRIISAAMVLSMCLSLIGVVQNEQSSVIAVAEEVTSDVLISVDINGSENRAQLKSPEFQDWTLTGNATPATATFEGVEFKLSTSTGNNFSKSENKALVTSSAAPYLTWDGADNAVSHDVYFGTDSDAVTTATHASDEYKGNQTETTYELPDNLTQQYTYYWRIDEIAADGNVVKGSTNMFKVRHIAFPSATGDGAYAKMARGARTVVVNTLEDTGAEGSLRWALEVEKGARIVVFEVTGVFKLNKVLTIPKEGSNVYVAGQTAPGEIIIENLPIIVEGANDVVFRNVKFTDTLLEIENLYGLIFNSSSNCIVDNCVFTSLDDGLITKGTSSMSIQNNKSDDGSDISKVTGTVVDTDQDGMPDVWEYTHGLDYKDKMDARDYNLSAEGYTNFEMYLNELMDETLVWNEYTEIPMPTEKPVVTPKPTETPDVTETLGPTETATPVPTGTETADPGSSEEPYLLGDVNKDGSVNAIDALMVLKHAAKLELLNDEQRLIANLDGNESIDAKDALKILRIAAKLDLD